MPPLPVRAILLALLVTTSAAAQSADLSLQLTAESLYNAGEVSTLRARVTNAGPDTAVAAGVRLTKISPRFAGASRYEGCVELPDSILCNTPTLRAGESHDFIVPFVPPDEPGTIRLNARTEAFSVDPNHDNDAATATAEVVKLGDLSVTLDVYPSLRTQQTSRVFVLVRNQAAFRPDTVTLFVTFPDPLQVTEANSTCVRVDSATYRCSFQAPERETAVGLYFDVVATRSAPAVTITASVESSSADWNTADNRTSRTLSIFDVPNLDVRITAPDAVDENNRAVGIYEFTNASDFPATNVTAEIITNPGTPDPTVSGDWTCTRTTRFRLQCTNPLIAPHSSSTLRVSVQYASRYFRGTFGTNVTQKPSSDFQSSFQSFFVDAVFYRPFIVANDADGGAGSLRQSIIDANAACSGEDGSLPCAIRFSEGVSTIAPRSALPLITVTDFAILGDGRITLDGSDAGDSDGLFIYSAGLVVRGMKIVNFAKNGLLSVTNRIMSLTRHHVVENNDLSSNGLRGLMAYMYEGEITSNVMNGNRRSGIFLTEQSSATIRDNRITNNGASGIYLGLTEAVIEHNEIADGAAFGVAIDRGARAQVLENRIVRNGQPGIDLGLDGPTLADTPRITSARFDPSTGETIIEGVIPRRQDFGYMVTTTAYVYANSTDEAGGDLFLGAVRSETSGHFTLRYKGDLTGKYIDAMTYRVTDFGDFILRESTEFGPRTPVTPI